MISAEQLKRMIENNAVVWGVNTKGEVYKRTFDYRPCHKEDYIKNFDYSEGDNLFITRAAAEWVAEVCATRTENFEPPYLDTLKDINKPVVYSFISKTGANLKLELIPEDKRFEGKIYLLNGVYCLKDWMLTKENWEDACRYCRELFIGNKQEGKMLDIKQMAKELNVCERTIWNHIKSGKIKAVRIGGVWRINEEEVKRYSR